MGKKVLSILLSAMLLLAVVPNVAAQEEIEIIDVDVGYDFGEEIRFSATVSAPSAIQEVLLSFRDVRENNTRVISLDPDETGRVSYAYNARENLLRPFAKITLEFEVKLENGVSKTSKSYSFIYTDNRFEWQTREEDNLRVHWYEGNASFGIAALDTARTGLQEIASLFPVDATAPLDIYIYASPAELQNALFMGGENWVAGHASPALGIVLVSIVPGVEEKILMERQIPHELAHVLLYRHLDEGYDLLPTWLLEGIASNVELYPNPDYELALTRAVDNNALIPIAELCAPFPRDASDAFLAYAEATSFTDYLYKEYGKSGMDALLRAYADGLSCETGANRALGKSLSYLDISWQEDVLGANLFGVAWRAILPFGLILLAFLALPLSTSISAWRKRKREEA